MLFSTSLFPLRVNLFFVVVIVVSVACFRKGSCRLFPCFWRLLVGLIDQNLSCMFGLIWLSKLVLKFCLEEGFQLFLNISAYVGFSLFSVSSIAVAFICALVLHFKLLNMFLDVVFFLLMFHLLRLLFVFPRIHSSITVVCVYL